MMDEIMRQVSFYMAGLLSAEELIARLDVIKDQLAKTESQVK